MRILRTLVRFLYWCVMNQWGKVGRQQEVHTELSVRSRGHGNALFGKNTYVGARTTLTTAENAKILTGENVWIGADCEISSLSSVEIGSHSSLQHRTQVHGEVRIGAGFIGAAGVYISSGNHEFRSLPALPIRLQDRLNALEKKVSRPVIVGEDCWLGINVVVMPGIEIGRGCVVGANSVVTRSLPPYSIAAGVPTKIIGTRLDFDPPSTLDATNDEDLPYFYMGFETIDGSEAVTKPKRLRGGFEAGGQFELACKPTDEGLVTLSINAKDEFFLRHGNKKIKIADGISTISFLALPDARGILLFEQECSSDVPIKGRLSVLAVNH